MWHNNVHLRVYIALNNYFSYNSVIKITVSSVQLLYDFQNKSEYHYHVMEINKLQTFYYARSHNNGWTLDIFQMFALISGQLFTCLENMSVYTI